MALIIIIIKPLNMNFALSVPAHPVCNFVTHERCIPDLKVPCRHVMADMIQVSVE